MKITMTIERLMRTFNQSKRYVDGGYYRIKTIDSTTVKLAYLISGPCGESIPCPEITILLKDKQAFPIHIIDLKATPPINYHRKNQIDDYLDNCFQELLKQFEKAEQIIKK